MDRSVMDAIRQQSDDLRDELKALEQWEAEVSRAAEAKKARKVPATSSSEASVEPPIRGTVPSIKDAMAQEAKKQGKTLPPEQDPIQLAKEKGNEYFRLGKTKEAVEAYTRGIDLDPKSAPTHILYGNRAMCYIKLGDWANAEKDASMCVQLNRGYAKGYFRRGVARRNLGKLKEARSDLESVLALVPNDASALAELELVTKQLQAERANATSAAAPKKKIVIEEVDDEDDDENEGGTANPVAAHSRAADDAAREARIRKQMEELEQARKASEEARHSELLREERSMEARRRHNPRVEVIEEEEEEVTATAKSAAPQTPEPTVVEAKKAAEEAPAVTKPQETRHTDPIVSDAQTKESPKAAKKSTAVPLPAVSARIHALPAKETLKQPNSFPEFERDFSLVEKDDELRNYYINLVNPSSLASLFGSSMTPEMLSGILKSVKAMPAANALAFMKGLGKVNRIGELALFFSDEEEQLVEDVVHVLKTSGAPETEVKAVMRPFK